MGNEVLTYGAVAVLASAISFGVLAFTRIPVIVVLASAIFTTGLHTVYGRFTGAHWDTVAVVTALTVLVFASVISLVFVGIGRSLRWSTFLEDPQP